MKDDTKCRKWGGLGQLASLKRDTHSRIIRPYGRVTRPYYTAA